MTQNSKFKLQNSRSAFTLIEVLVVVAVGAAITTGGFLMFSRYQRDQNVRLTLSELSASVRDIQRRSVTQENGKQWGIRISGTDNSFKTWSGLSYASGTPDQTYSLKRNIRFGNPPSGFSIDLAFKAITGLLGENRILTVNGGAGSLVGDLIINTRGKATTRFEEGLMGYWHFDEATSTIAYDASGNGNNGTLTNGPTWQTSASCRAGECLSFNGTNYVIGPSSNIITGNNLQTITISAWVKTTATGAQYPVAVKRSSAQSTLISITSNQDLSGNTAIGYLGFLTRNYADSAHSWLVASGGYNDGRWHHVVGVVNNMTRTLYIDGIQKGTDSTQGMQKVSGNTAPLYIGSFDNSQLFFNGSVDEVRIYDRALSAQEVLDMYNDLK